MASNTGLLVLNYPESYVFRSWHGTLLTMAILCLSVTFNTFFAQKLHLVVCVISPGLKRSELNYALGRRRIGLARGGLLLHPHPTLGACRESSVTRSMDDLLRPRMGKSRTVLLDRHRRQCRSSAWSRRVW